MTWVISLLVAIGIAAGGCAGPSGMLSEADRKAEEAKNVLPENYKSDLLAFMRTYLNDPENVRGAALSQPQKLMVGETERYAACLRYDAKNSAGKYIGSRDSLAIFLSGKFDRMIDLGRTETNPQEAARRLSLREFCAKAAYQPFPELEHLRR